MKKLLILLGAMALTFTLSMAEGKCDGSKYDSSKKTEKKCESGKCDMDKKTEKCSSGKCDTSKNEKKEAPEKAKCGQGKCG